MSDGFVLSERGMRYFVRQFTEAHPATRDPAHVRDRCMDYCDAFVEYLRKWGGSDLIVDIISGVKMEGNLVLQGHYAVLHDGTVYDWTARQFDPDAQVPKISTLAEWRQEWPTWEEAMK